jgi:murein DD-endopeptidase MepM/ murein hydrolase activator NlpD
MSLTRVWQSASRWHVTQQLLIWLLAVLLMTVLALSRPVRAAPLHHTAARVQTQDTFQGTVAPGQSAFALLRQAGVSAPEVLHLQRAIRSVYDLQHLRIGQPYWVDVTADGLLQRFVYEVDTQHRLEVERQGQTFCGRLVPIASEPQERVVHGIIRGSLYKALASQGETSKLAADLADIFAWEIDFSKDVRDGDTFRLLIQESSQDGTVVDSQRILAAELVNQGRVIQAVYYAPDGTEGAYYHPDGRSLRRLFLRSPLRYTRISSGFSRRRLHPILGQYRPHFGIDYAAPRGTPVRSVADGVVVQAGRQGANGNMIKIRHNRVYSTYYLHLSRFARGLRAGRRVTQGQVIGYVGATGLATGPHLCFRLTKNGMYLNPLRHQSLEAPSMARQALPAFRTYAKRLLAKLEPSEATPQQVAAHVSTLGAQDTETKGK